MLAHIRVKTDPSQTEAKHDKQIPRMDDDKGGFLPFRISHSLIHRAQFHDFQLYLCHVH